jgi:hypothetical protein
MGRRYIRFVEREMFHSKGSGEPFLGSTSKEVTKCKADCHHKKDVQKPIFLPLILLPSMLVCLPLLDD